MDEQMDLTQVKGVESEGIDLNKYDKSVTMIDSAEVLSVPSEYTPKDDKGLNLRQWVLKVSSEVIDTVGEEEDKIEFRASELFNLIQDKKGRLVGFPRNENSNLGKFTKDLKIDLKTIENLGQLVEVMKGKKAVIKAYEKDYEVDGKSRTRTYLKFRY